MNRTDAMTTVVAFTHKATPVYYFASVDVTSVVKVPAGKTVHIGFVRDPVDDQVSVTLSQISTSGGRLGTNLGELNALLAGAGISHVEARFWGLEHSALVDLVKRCLLLLGEESASATSNNKPSEG